MTKQSNFYDLIRQFAEAGDEARRDALEQEVWSAFGRSCAVLVLDMSGFSRSTLRYGIVHYLSLILRMQELARAEIERCGGEVVKFEADNCYAAFPQAAQALAAARNLNERLSEANRGSAEETHIRISCGIDFGQVLFPYHHDFFGNPVNRASKLGEDIAQPGEIILTEEAWSELTPPVAGRKLDLSVFGSKITVWQIAA